MRPRTTTHLEGLAVDAMTGLRAAMAEVEAYYKERGIFQEQVRLRRAAGAGRDRHGVRLDRSGLRGRLGAARRRRSPPSRQLLPAARGKDVPIFYTTSAAGAPQLKSAADYSPKFRPWDERACDIDERRVDRSRARSSSARNTPAPSPARR